MPGEACSMGRSIEQSMLNIFIHIVRLKMFTIIISGKEVASWLTFIVILSSVTLKTFSMLSGVIVPTEMYIVGIIGVGFLFCMFGLFLLALRTMR